VDYSDFIDIEAPAEVALHFFSDLPGLGRLSPENKGGVWQDGATGPALGVRFKVPMSTATLSGPPPRRSPHMSRRSASPFASPRTAADSPVGLLRDPDSWGCRVTECWTDLRSDVLKRDDKRNDNDRVKFTEESTHTTQVRLKAFSEGSADDREAWTPTST
jgi:hypothetical protein